jgi:glycosyltransferase involved in cell wall biosynthesis
MGEHVRSVYKALLEAGAEPRIVDIYGPGEVRDQGLINSYAPDVSPMLGDDINIFCINGDEVDQSFAVLKDRNLHAPGCRNIIYPAWELSNYPADWGRVLDHFDEVWAPSAFNLDAYAAATSTSVVHLPLACEITSRSLLSRRGFGIPESSFTFFFAFDFLSYLERKNPFAVLDAFAQAVEMRPHADMRLVLKLNNADRKPQDFARFQQAYSEFRDRVVLLKGNLTDLDMKALMWLNDCFVSLHRSEGWGRGMSEAMVLGKPVIATAYSGNMDFCTADTAMLVPYAMVPVRAGEYPHWQGQEWAEADTEVAAKHMVALVDDPDLGPSIGRRARAHMIANFSFLECGTAYARRCEELRADVAARGSFAFRAPEKQTKTASRLGGGAA